MQVFSRKLPERKDELRTLLLLLRVAAWVLLVSGVLTAIALPFLAGFAVFSLLAVLAVLGVIAAGVFWADHVFGLVADGRPNADTQLLAFAVVAIVLDAGNLLQATTAQTRIVLPILLVVGILLLVKRSDWMRSGKPSAAAQSPP